MIKDLNQKNLYPFSEELRELLYRHGFACMNIVVLSNNHCAAFKITQRDILFIDKQRCDQIDDLLDKFIKSNQGGQENAKGSL